ncbi:hypothetical protein [Arthrobacter sp. C9C5]|uniref:hypothetical protein n=1 Tax=Arthrobacter sp. C9C5 TaxID=2735267 RepID=UPI00158586FF|nr:hypothetical protein [Arthrobacter sp. C9C5]NUU30124.1 hypothetical protein [Arthrobacter sp. C9C5]
MSVKIKTRMTRRFGAVLCLVIVLLSAGIAQPASAASRIDGPYNLVCEKYDNKLSVNPPRIWASNRTELVLWKVYIWRWDGAKWNQYVVYDFWSTYNVFGQSLTSWGPWYHNSTMNLPVNHSGYYRITSAIVGTQGGVQFAGHVDGGKICYVS